MRNDRGMNTAATAVLWASAFLIAALVIVQAGRLPVNPAYADMAVAEGGYTLLTTDSGRGEDAAPNELLYVLDSREEVILVYEIEDARQKQVFLRDGGSLRNLFITGRR
jgi:hypothetical protein